MSEEIKEAAKQQTEPFLAKSGKEVPSRNEEDDEKTVNLRVKLFTANFSVLVLLFIAGFSYAFGVIRMVEKKFGFSSLKTGTIFTVTDVLNLILVIFVGYIGQKVHKPRLIGFSVSLIGIAFIVCSGGSYFYFKNTTPVTMMGNQTEAKEFSKPNIRLCDLHNNTSTEECDLMDNNADGSSGAYMVYVLGAILIGIGGVAPFPLGFSYIDENLPKKDSAAYIGLTLGAFPVGPIIGFSMAAVFTRLPEDLRDYKGMDPRDPRFIGAWWLGFIIIGVLLLIFSIPMCFHAKHHAMYRINKKKIQKKTTKDTGSTFKTHLKAFASSLWSLLTNAPLMFLVMSNVFAMYMIQVFANQPRYVEAHFHTPAYTANLISVVCGALSSAIGSITAGFIIRRLQMGPLSLIKSYIISVVLVCAGLLVLMFVSCDELKLAGYDGNSLELGRTCNMDCNCEMKFDPVCSSDGQTHFSACQAGCQSFSNETYGNCGCIENTNEILKGTCEQNCTTQLILYAVIYFAWNLLSSFGKVAGTIVLLRLVEINLKSLALSVNSFFYHLLGFIPAPMIYGSVIDSTCLIWQQTCDGGRGACQLYKTSNLRQLLHGVTLAFQVCGFLFSIGIWLTARKKVFVSDEEENEKQEA